MHSSRDANSFSRASPRVRSLNLNGARTNNFQQRYGQTELAVILSVYSSREIFAYRMGHAKVFLFIRVKIISTLVFLFTRWPVNVLL